LNFEFATAARIVFGPGTVSQTGKIAARFGTKAFLVTGRDGRRAESVIVWLSDAGVACKVFNVCSEPTSATVTAGAKSAQEFGAQVVIGIGGGSAVDAGKAISALATNHQDIFEYLEVVGAGKPLLSEPLPYIAIPTTAGTGAEVTRNAVLSVPERQTKVSLRSPAMLPKVAIVDPELTFALPPDLTATTGLDALTQLIEPFVCARPNPITDSFCRAGMRLCARSLRTAFQDGQNATAREDMATASLFGGLALANSGLGAVHGFAAAIGGMFPIAHGAICAALLPHVWRTNVEVSIREQRIDLLARFKEATEILTGKESRPESGGEWLDDLVDGLQVPSLGAAGVKRELFPDICDKAARASSMKANPVQLSSEDLMQILENAF
jgi:alcohol dehydrogenase class IV